MNLAIERTDHIHARVGYPEGPRVSDPRAGELRQAFERHLVWWDRVVERKRILNQVLTITPEFGPFPIWYTPANTGAAGQPVGGKSLHAEFSEKKIISN